MDDRGTGSHEGAAGNFLGASTLFDAARSRRRFRVAVLVVVLFLAAGGYALWSWTKEAVWYLPDGCVPNPASTSVDIFVMGLECTSGDAFWIAKPRVELTATTVTIAVRTHKRLSFSENCQAVKPQRVHVDVGEPIGNRELVDAYGDLNSKLNPIEVREPGLQAPLAAQR